MPEPKNDIIELQLQIDELSWGNIKNLSHIIQYKTSISDELVPARFTNFDNPPPIITNRILLDYMIDNCESVNDPTQFMEDIKRNGKNLDRICLVSIISIEDDRHVYLYFNRNKILTGCEPSEVINRDGNPDFHRIRYHESEITTKLCRLIQPYLTSGDLNWDWFRKRFRIDIDWQ